VLAPDVRFEGFGVSDWQRVLELFRPARPHGRPRDPDRPRGAVVAVHDGGALRKLVHSRVGRLRLDDLAPVWPVGAEELARRHAASFGVVLERGALDDALEAVARRLGREHDLTAQWLLLASAVREQIERGRIELWPRRLRGVPVPTPAVVERTLDMVCPVGKAMMLGLFEAGELWTCVTLRRGARGFDWVLGPDEIRRAMGLLSGDFRRDHRHLARLCEERVGPLALGCFAERTTFRALEVDPRPGAWALAVAVRDVVLSPVPLAMAVPLGLDAGRAAAVALRGLAARVDPQGVLGGALDAVREVAGGGRELSLLGFQPLELVRRLLSRER
jgi:hypothetical protein